MQTEEGRLKARETIRKKYGVTQDGKSKLHMTIGKKGGQKLGVTKGFAAVPGLAKEAALKSVEVRRNASKN